MAFKPPGGELTVLSALWILFGIGAVIVAVTMGLNGYLILGALVGLPAVGMWFEQRWCGYLFTALMAIAIPMAIFALIMLDDTIAERASRLMRIVLAGYFGFVTFRWANDQ